MSRSQIALLSVVSLVGFADPTGSADPNIPVTPENTPPSVVLAAPTDGGWLNSGPLPFKVAVTDAEDGVIDCTKIVVTYQSDGIPVAEATPAPDCTGVLEPDAAVGKDAYVTATYTDSGALTGTAEAVLHSREYQGPSFGIQSAEPFGFPRINLAGINHLTVEFATGGALTMHADSPDGPVVASFADVPATGGWFAADVTDPGGVHDLFFVSEGAGVRLIRFQTVPAVTATVTPAAPASGWHTTDATLSVGAVPLWQQQVSLDGGATWLPADAPTVLTVEGTHQVQYRAIDAAGRTSAPATATVRIDRTAPAVTAVGTAFGHSAVLDLPTATDAGSGVAASTVTLDGVAVAAPVELWRQPAGLHDLTITATDAAGNTTTTTTKVEITTSLAELTPLMARFPLPFVKSLILRFQLMAAESALERGRISQALMWVSAFRAAAAKLRDPAAMATLTADADLVLAQVPTAGS